MKQKRTYCLLETDLLYLSKLLQVGYTITDALPYISKQAEEMQKHLAMGEDIQTVLLEGTKGRFRGHLQFFIQISSLQMAIESAHAMMHFENSIKKKLLQKAAYPMFILLFSYVMLIFFTRYILPAMMEGMLENEGSSTTIFLMHFLQSSCQIIGVIVFALIIFAAILWKNNELRIRSVLFCSKRLSLLCDYQSYAFAGYMLRLTTIGVSTKLAISYLLKAKENTVFHNLMQRIESGLLKGKDLLAVLENTVLINEDLQKSFRIGILTSTLSETLQTYISQQEIMWDRKMRHYALGVQCVAYIFVGILVLLVYQVMLMPLSMLNMM